jgi:hypothetical protein
MNSDQATGKVKPAWKAVKELLEKAQRGVQRELTKAAPKVQKTLDTSLETGSKLFASTMKTIDVHTEKEQLELLRGYRRFLEAQVKYLDAKLKPLEDKVSSRKK